MSEKAALYIAIVIGMFVLAISVAAMSQPKYVQSDYEKAKAAEIPDDKCATPPGYTDQKWKEHMGHHPDQYAECLK